MSFVPPIGKYLVYFHNAFKVVTDNSTFTFSDFENTIDPSLNIENEELGEFYSDCKFCFEKKMNSFGLTEHKYIDFVETPIFALKCKEGCDESAKKAMINKIDNKYKREKRKLLEKLEILERNYNDEKKNLKTKISENKNSVSMEVDSETNISESCSGDDCDSYIEDFGIYELLLVGPIDEQCPKWNIYLDEIRKIADNSNVSQTFTQRVQGISFTIII